MTVIYLEYISKVGKYGPLGIKHSVFIRNGFVISYEMYSLGGDGRFKLYRVEKLQTFIKSIEFEKEIKDFNILKYTGRTGKGIICFEALQIIAKMENIEMPRTLKKRVKTIFKNICLATLFLSIGFCIGSLFGYYAATQDPEDFKIKNNCICQE